MTGITPEELRQLQEIANKRQVHRKIDAGDCNTIRKRFKQGHTSLSEIFADFETVEREDTILNHLRGDCTCDTSTDPIPYHGIREFGCWDCSKRFESTERLRKHHKHKH